MKISYIKFKKTKFLDFVLSLLLILTVLISSYIGSFIKRYNYDALNASNEPSIPTVIIDAGHGGEDPGAISKSGILEKDLNLEISLMIGEILSEKGYAVIYTRTDDKLLYKEEENVKGIRKISDLKNRCKIGEENPEAIFVSIHMNSFGCSEYSGLQVYYSTKENGSRELAEAIQNRVREDIQNDNRRKTKLGKNMYLMENLTNTAVLIECGFLTNEDEAKRLSEKEYQKNLSFSIVCGIIEYIEKQ